MFVLLVSIVICLFPSCIDFKRDSNTHDSNLVNKLPSKKSAVTLLASPNHKLINGIVFHHL